MIEQVSKIKRIDLKDLMMSIEKVNWKDTGGAGKETSRESYFLAEPAVHRGQTLALTAILLANQAILGNGHVSGTACERKRFQKLLRNQREAMW